MMHDDRDNDTPKRPKDKEPSLKDALMPAKPKAPAPGAKKHSLPRDTYGESPSLKDALLPEDHQPSPPPPTSAAPKPTPKAAPAPKRPKGAPAPAPAGSNYVLQILVSLIIVAGFVVVFFVGRATGPSGLTPASDGVPKETSAAVSDGETESDGADTGGTATSEPTPSEAVVDWGDPGPMSIAAIQEQGLIIDVHEHIESLEEAPMFVAAMDALGIQKMCLMGSSKFTLTLNESYGFTQVDENNNELIKIVDAYPGRFEAWPTLDPTDPDKLSKIQGLVARGATGVKLYIGHGYVAKDHTYMFHPVAMDDPGMLPFYAWCQDQGIPLAFHVNPYQDKKGFAEEFVAVLTQYPDLKVIAPHFILSSVKSSRLEELLDTFPNLYSDVSFGDYFMKERLTYISKYPAKFTKIFNAYPTRFMFAADLVMIKGRQGDWAPTQLQAYLDMLTKSSYTTSAIPGETLTGLSLSDDLVSRILFRNYLEFRVRQPKGTKITHEINWKRMNVEPVEREPGQAFPPQPKQR